MVLSWHLQDSVVSRFAAYSHERRHHFCKTSDFAVSQNHSNLNNARLFDQTCHETETWARLFLEVREVIDYMYDLHQPNQSSIPVKSETLLLIYTAEISKVVDRIEKSRAVPKRLTKTIAFEVDIRCARQKVLEVLLAVVNVETEINGVVVASSNADCVASVLDTVATESMFKWRRFLHITEWIALLVDCPYFNADFTPFQQISLPDFVTLLFIRERKGSLKLNVAQKSRIEPMGSGARLCLHLTSTLTKNSLFHAIDLSPFPNQTFQSILNRNTLSSYNIRKSAASFLSTQKSVMADMIIPVVLLVSEPERNAFPVTEGGKTTWTGFSVEILNLLSKALGFTSLPFAVTDGGFYGLYEADGDALGLVGYLTRREAGLTTMAMFFSEKRRQDVDFLYPAVKASQTYVIYKVEKQSSQLGDLYSQLVKGNNEILLLLTGPCVALIAGLVVFLVNGVLVNRGKLLGRQNLKRLFDFPFHWVFQTTELWRHKSCRILRATWALFSVILFATYGALMTSNAAAPVERPVISSLEDLLAHSEIAIGISPSSSKTVTTLSRAKRGTTKAQLWEKLVRLNKSDGKTFNPDKGYHMRRVLKGNYAFISGLPKVVLQSYVDADFSDVRFFDVINEYMHMAIPQNVFYKAEIERALLLATESGTIKAVYDKWFSPDASLEKSEVKDTTVIHLARLELLFSMTACGTGLAFLSLVIEQLLHFRRTQEIVYDGLSKLSQNCYLS
ncbi:glutamate receptor ionotropic, delta-2 [Plakobranchus ocellatus]|uniref:Glutamate receptor ionotropic, delta-2 n=1 Tax=Plakobranchus ocellatus TaxID=259542 RepID=A0AAV4BUF8_9GAST|nr:glutamate receptor ionotropic, delta-2 [Plakobranchus ocellatus]